MPRIPRFGRPGALKIRQPPATQAPVEALPSPTAGGLGEAASPAPVDSAEPATAVQPVAAEPASAAAEPAPAVQPVAAEPASAAAEPAPATPAVAPSAPTSFRERAGLRRRLRFLRSARELALRDLGGLTFELHRFGRKREDLLGAKLTTLGRIDSELRLIENALDDREPVTVLHEAGIAACRRCAAIHGSDARFCPYCGLAVGRRALVPMAAPAIPSEVPPPTAAEPAPAGVPPAAATVPATATPPTAAAPPTADAPPAADAQPAGDQPPGDAPSPGNTARHADTNGDSRGRAPSPPPPGASGHDGSEQPTRVGDTVVAEDSEPSAR